MSSLESLKIATLKAKSENIASYNLPELPDSDAADIYERISQHERLASPTLDESDYRSGSALFKNEMHLDDGTISSLLTAEHATDHIRKDEPKAADWGVMGLGRVVHEDIGTGFIATKGHQTGDPNYDAEHPFKEEIGRIMRVKKPSIIAGLHGMAGGKFADIDDEKPLDVLIGVGSNPNEKTMSAAEDVKKAAKGLDLRVGINQRFLKTDNGLLVPDEDGKPKGNNFKAAGSNTTRAFEQAKAEELGYEPALMQVELSSLLRRMPRGLEFDPRSAVMGAYVGYLLTRKIVEIGTA